MSLGREYRLGGRTRIRHDARTLLLRGKDSPGKKEHGRYVKCWNCGFICDTERDDLGGAQSRAGDGAEFYYAMYPQSSGSDRGVVATLSLFEEGMSGESLTLASYSMRRGHRRGMLLGPDGSEVPIELTYVSKVTGGCSFCGTRNYRGDFR